ncbi:hypothetical protein, partial [Alicyclobacillus acidiphilus]|uniref:hypothetical protein n=1 Tax=Alicyclobacillus acidiphilus TaxID=182455 RepID=UPI000A6569C4
DLGPRTVVNKGQKYRYRHRAAPKAWSRHSDKGQKYRYRRRPEDLGPRAVVNKGQKYRYPIRPQTTRLR